MTVVASAGNIVISRRQNIRKGGRLVNDVTVGDSLKTCSEDRRSCGGRMVTMQRSALSR
jgi:hypothetical protein